MNWFEKTKEIFLNNKSKNEEIFNDKKSQEEVFNKTPKWQMLKIDLQILENDLSKKYIILGQNYYKKVKNKKISEKKLKTDIDAIEKIYEDIHLKQKKIKNLEAALLAPIKHLILEKTKENPPTQKHEPKPEVPTKIVAKVARKSNLKKKIGETLKEKKEIKKILPKEVEVLKKSKKVATTKPVATTKVAVKKAKNTTKSKKK